MPYAEALMLFRPAPKFKAWWDTDRCRQWPMSGLILYLVGKRIAYVGHSEPANDRDQHKW